MHFQAFITGTDSIGGVNQEMPKYAHAKGWKAELVQKGSHWTTGTGMELSGH